MNTENLSTLKIHKLTKEQYERELEAGRIDESALYLTPDEEIDLSPYATKEELNTRADVEHDHTIEDIANLQSSLDDKVSMNRTINGKDLTANIILSASDVGAAPAGYGYGESAIMIEDLDTVSELHAELENLYTGMRWQETKMISFKCNEISAYYRWTAIISVWGSNASVEAWSSDNLGTSIKINRYEDGWYPVEWVNPPMIADVEYRTTERYNGKHPVYIKLIDCGALPNATHQDHPVGTTVTNVVSLDVIAADADNVWRYHLPAIWGNGTVYCYACVVGNNVRIYANNYDMSSHTGKAVIKYTKD